MRDSKDADRLQVKSPAYQIITKSTLKNIHNKLRYQAGKPNAKIHDKLTQNIVQAKKFRKKMQDDQKAEFIQRLRIIFGKDYDELSKRFFSENETLEMVKNTVNKKRKIINVLGILGYNFSRTDKQAKRRHTRESRISMIPFNAVRPAEYPQNNLSSKYRLGSRITHKSEYHKMLIKSRKVADSILPFKTKIFQASHRLDANQQKLASLRGPSKSKELVQSRLDAATNPREPPPDILDRILIPKQQNSKVVRKIRDMCQSLNVLRPDEIKKGFNALKLLLEIKHLIQEQIKLNDLKRISRSKDPGSARAIDPLRKSLGGLRSRKEILKKIQSVLGSSKRLTRRISEQKLKVFKNNFIKLAMFVRDSGLRNVDLMKLIPSRPYNEPQAKEVARNGSSSSRPSWAT